MSQPSLACCVLRRGGRQKGVGERESTRDRAQATEVEREVEVEREREVEVEREVERGVERADIGEHEIESEEGGYTVGGVLTSGAGIAAHVR